ncbi:helix-turn-helix domain-containing protein [Variovorax paradoxus]|jgi:AraC-like DNA-binding protein|uniref:helix-turn-helix domain-containing protein n=1 Tax=Variovorax paradoxus TaxID=34073 RepID=UPI003391BE17
MPQERTLLYTGHEFTVEHVRSRAHQGPDWSIPYTLESRRIIFPVGRTALDVRTGNDTWLVDGLTAMQFCDAMVYQLRPVVHAARHSMVVSRHRPSRADAAPVFCLLSPRSMYRVHAAQRQLRAGDAGADAIASLVDELGISRRQLPLTGAVMRAKRLLAETADREAKLPMHEVADAVSRSPFHLARSFRQQTGLSLHQYRQHLRLAAAMERLVDGDSDLAGIAHDLGYCSQSHLGAVFRREVGVTLGEARRVLAGSARI